MQRKQYLIAILAILLTSSTMLSFTTARYAGLRQTVASLAWDYKHEKDPERLAQLTKAYSAYMSQQGIGSIRSRAFMLAQKNNNWVDDTIPLLNKPPQEQPKQEIPDGIYYGSGPSSGGEAEPDSYQSCLNGSQYEVTHNAWQQMQESTWDDQSNQDPEYAALMIRIYHDQMEKILEICGPLKYVDQAVDTDTGDSNYKTCLTNSGWYQLMSQFNMVTAGTNTPESYSALNDWIAGYRSHIADIEATCEVYNETPEP